MLKSPLNSMQRTVASRSAQFVFADQWWLAPAACAGRFVLMPVTLPQAYFRRHAFMYVIGPM